MRIPPKQFWIAARAGTRLFVGCISFSGSPCPNDIMTSVKFERRPMYDPKFKKGDKVTVWFVYSSGRREVSATGEVFSIRWVNDKWLYQIFPEYLALENEMTAYDGEVVS
jgi:hypothetical protein